MELGTHERWLLMRFLVWLIGDHPFYLGDGRTVERRAEFRAEKPQDRKRRLRMLRAKSKRGQLPSEDQSTLDLLERTSFYANKDECIYGQKPAGQKAHDKIHEGKRLYVAALVCRRLWPVCAPWEILESKIKHYESRSPRALEMRLREFEKEQIESGPLTCQGIVEERFTRYKSFYIMARIPRLANVPSPDQAAQRMEFLRAQGALMAITESERALLTSLCQRTLFQKIDIER